jgi:cysteinyl-tRNA synthetase
MRSLGVVVEVCRNITDVDDDMLAAAAASGTRFDELAAVQQFQFDRDMAALGVASPTHEPRIHNHVAQVAQLAAGLLGSGQAYASGGSVYFRATGLAERAGLDEQEALALARGHGDRPDDPAKENPLDVVVWQGAGNTEPAWPSPWGPGRPGWHAGCASMALTLLGPALDLHVGGADLRFPHHASESALAESLTGVRPFARAWMHVGTVCIDGEKMAKSSGNLVLVQDLLSEHRPAAIRLALLQRHWHDKWDFQPAALDTAEQTVDDLMSAAGQSREGGDAAQREVQAALLDGLDVKRAVAVGVDSGGAAARLAIRLLGLPG